MQGYAGISSPGAVLVPGGDCVLPPEPVEDLSYRLGRSEARLDLTERTESILREERDRLLGELAEERAERRRLTERLELLTEERGEPVPEEPPEPDEGPEGTLPPDPTGEDASDEPHDERGWGRRFFGFGQKDPPKPGLNGVRPR